MHKITLEYDEKTQALKIVHRATVQVGGHTVSHAEEIKLTDESQAVANLKELLEANREAVEERAMELAITHVATVGARAVKGVKQVSLGGALGISGQSQRRVT